MILSNKRIINALFSLCMCAGCSVPLFFVNTEDRGPFTRVVDTTKTILTTIMKCHDPKHTLYCDYLLPNRQIPYDMLDTMRLRQSDPEVINWE